MKTTNKGAILAYLAKGPEWGGVLEREIGKTTGSKGGTIGRILRKMEEEGLLDKCYRKVAGVPIPCVRYRIHQ